MSKPTLEQLCRPLNVELEDSEKLELFDKKQNELDEIKEEHKALEQEFRSYESSLESARIAFSDRLRSPRRAFQVSAMLSVYLYGFMSGSKVRHVTC